MREVSHPSHLVAYALVITLVSGGLYAAQLFFVFSADSDSQWSWPEYELPVGYVSASIMLLSPVFCVAAACTRLRKWLIVAVFLAVCSTAVAIALGANSLVKYLEDDESKFALFTMSALNIAAGVLCGIYAILIVSDVFHCHSKQKIDQQCQREVPMHSTPTPNYPQYQVISAYVVPTTSGNNLPYPTSYDHQYPPAQYVPTDYPKSEVYPTAPPPYEP